MKDDILSDVLSTVSLTGAIFFDVEAATPWVAEAPPSALLAPLLEMGSEHIIEYHVITRGFCWVSLVDSDSPPIRVAPGSIIMFPQGDAHILSSQPYMRSEPNFDIFEQPENLSPPYYIQNFGGGTEKTRFICGFIGCDMSPYNPIIQALPPIVHIPDGYSSDDGWLKSLITGILVETENKRAGSSNILSRLSELIFIEVVRNHMASLSSDAFGWLAALADRHIGHAIRLFHNNPERNWTLDILAKEVGLSRTALVNRFTDHLGVAPITYLCNWRMQVAAWKLRNTGSPIARIAEEVGYKSEAAFSRTFKRVTNRSPGAWRLKSGQ